MGGRGGCEFVDQCAITIISYCYYKRYWWGWNGLYLPGQSVLLLFHYNIFIGNWNCWHFDFLLVEFTTKASSLVFPYRGKGLYHLKVVILTQGWALFFFRGPHNFCLMVRGPQTSFEVNLSQKTCSEQINSVINLNITFRA